MRIKGIFPLMVFCTGLGLAWGLLWILNPAQQAAAASAAPAAIRCVTPGGTGGCYTTIQAAVNAANPGDTVRVAQGVYIENVVVNKSITLEGGWNTGFTSRNWDLYTTVVNGNRASTVIRLSGNISPTIEGFTILRGDASSALGWGGGILADGVWSEGGLITIRHNIIRENIACKTNWCQGYGGGIMIYSNRSIIEYNTIFSNTARTGGAGGGYGGGIAIWGYPGEATIAHNMIISNTAVYSTSGEYSLGEGGGVWTEGACDVTATDNDIHYNVAAEKGAGYGGGAHACGEWYENRILTNTASLSGPGYGGGVDAYYLGDFNENRVQGNLASRNGDGTGGGVYALYLRNALRNEIVGNFASRGGGVYYQEYVGSQSFEDNYVAQNWATGLNIATQDGGGGISSKADWVEFNGNTFFNNNALAGGGVLFTGGDNFIMDNNQFIENWALAGGGMYVYSATGEIVQNHIIGNHALWWGGGMYLHTQASPRMDRNIVMNNIADGTTGFAGGGLVLDVGAGTRITLTNHIIANNSILAGTASGVHCLSGSCVLIHNTIVDNKLGANPGEGVRIGALDATNVLWNNLIVGHSTGVFVNSAPVSFGYNNYFDNGVAVSGAGAGTHATYLNPQFVNRAGSDYHLNGSSPMINAGDSSRSTLFDFEGNPRLKQPDIGAYEFILSRLYLPLVLHNWINWGGGGP